MNTKKFQLGTVLTVTTGRLLTARVSKNDNGIGDLYKILDWMTNDTSFTHSLGRFSEECKPWLYRWFPELKEAESRLEGPNKSLDTMMAEYGAKEGIAKWIQWMVSDYGIKEEYEVPKIPMDDHETKDPVDELREMVGDKPVIVIEELGGI